MTTVEQRLEVLASSEVVARSIFSKRLLPGESHEEAAMSHQELADFHKNATSNLREDFRKTPNRKARRDILSKLKEHDAAATKHQALADRHVIKHNKANPKDPIATADHQHGKTEKPSLIKRLGKHFMDAYHKFSPAEKYSYTETHPTSPVTAAHYGKAAMPHTDPKVMPQYHKDQADYHQKVSEHYAGKASKEEAPVSRQEFEDLKKKHSDLQSLHAKVVNHLSMQQQKEQEAKNAAPVEPAAAKPEPAKATPHESWKGMAEPHPGSIAGKGYAKGTPATNFKGSYTGKDGQKYNFPSSKPAAKKPKVPLPQSVI